MARLRREIALRRGAAVVGLGILALVAGAPGAGSAPGAADVDGLRQVTLIYHGDGKGKIEPCG